jgi:hypothetical protein
MHSRLTLPAVILLSMSLGACSATSKAPSSTADASKANTASTTVTAQMATGSPRAQANPQRDVDGDNENNDDDYNSGHAASTATTRAVRALVGRYYADAAAGNGAQACSLVYSIFAEEIPEEYGEPPGPPALRGSTCATVLSKLFKREHRRMAADLTQLEVAAVRVKAHHALVLLSFRTKSREIRVHLEHGVWKIDELLDSALG